jgi:hypothetical protein
VAQPAARGIRWQVIIGTIVSLVGAVALSVSADVITSTIPLPHHLASMLNWHWP